MINQKLTETLRKLEIEQGFVAAFDVLWGMCAAGEMKTTDESLTEEMQRWHLLYGEEYEGLCTAMGIDFTNYEVE